MAGRLPERGDHAVPRSPRPRRWGEAVVSGGSRSAQNPPEATSRNPEAIAKSRTYPSGNAGDAEEEPGDDRRHEQAEGRDDLAADEEHPSLRLTRRDCP